jgi:nicotinate phosphoribosyltransferase
VRSVRIDSGSYAAHARAVRHILDGRGLRGVSIFASGGLDEYALRDLLAAGVPIDGFGLGTRVVTSADAPSLDIAYKLVEYAGRPRYKRSEGKATLPGAKQVRRFHDAAGSMRFDELTLLEEPASAGRPLLLPAMRRGRRVAFEGLTGARARAVGELLALPAGLRRLRHMGSYPVRSSEGLRDLERQTLGADRAAEEAGAHPAEEATRSDAE